MLRLKRRRLFRNRQRLRRHRKREMANNRTNGVLMPVINGEIGRRLASSSASWEN
jgi:hypothetical protein